MHGCARCGTLLRRSHCLYAAACRASTVCTSCASRRVICTCDAFLYNGIPCPTIECSEMRTRLRNDALARVRDGRQIATSKSTAAT